MVFHTHKVGLATVFCVYVLLLYADYALVYRVIEYGKNRSVGTTFEVLLAHFLVLMIFFCHLRAMLSDPGYVPLPHTNIDFSSDLEKSGSKKIRKVPGIDEWTVCTQCETYRPPRSHHCRKCDRCVRRMDHHCPWTNNCIGESNMKYFFLFIVYTGLFCLYCIILIVLDWKSYKTPYSSSSDKFMTIFLFFESVIFFMFVSAIGAGQTMAILCDRNALEMRRYGTPSKFPNTPRLVLIQALCGRGSKLLWPIPCVSPRILAPIPPQKYSMFSNNSIHNV